MLAKPFTIDALMEHRAGARDRRADYVVARYSEADVDDSRSRRPPSTRRSSRSTTSSAPRRAARSASARRRSRSRPRSSRATRDLFSRAQIEALREAEDAASGDERERLYRLRKTCEAGVVSSELAEQEDALENAILGARVTFKGEEMPLRSAQARLAVLDVVRATARRSASSSAPSRPASTTTGSR